MTSGSVVELSLMKLWEFCIPLKVKTFIWMAKHDSIQSGVQWMGPEKCKMWPYSVPMLNCCFSLVLSEGFTGLDSGQNLQLAAQNGLMTYSKIVKGKTNAFLLCRSLMDYIEITEWGCLQQIFFSITHDDCLHVMLKTRRLLLKAKLVDDASRRWPRLQGSLCDH